MTAGSGDRSERTHGSSARPGLAQRASDETCALRGRALGCCRVCGKPVFSQQNFTRAQGHVSHVRCAALPLS